MAQLFSPSFLLFFGDYSQPPKLNFRFFIVLTFLTPRKVDAGTIKTPNWIHVPLHEVEEALTLGKVIF